MLLLVTGVKLNMSHLLGGVFHYDMKISQPDSGYSLKVCCVVFKTQYAHPLCVILKVVEGFKDANNFNREVVVDRFGDKSFKVLGRGHKSMTAGLCAPVWL